MSTESLLRELAISHEDHADDLEKHACHWWRVSKYAWLHAAFVHRLAAKELLAVAERVRRDDPEPPRMEAGSGHNFERGAGAEEYEGDVRTFGFTRPSLSGQMPEDLS
jgi:hypothetical protein